jgi:hypothetical protein
VRERERERERGVRPCILNEVGTPVSNCCDTLQDVMLANFTNHSTLVLCIDSSFSIELLMRKYIYKKKKSPITFVQCI